MLYPFDDAHPFTPWEIATPQGVLRVRPAPGRVAGLAIFASRRQALEFLRHAEGFQGMHVPAQECHPRRCRHDSLDAMKEAWRAAGEDLVYIRPRRPFGGHGAFDADVLLL